MVHTRLNERETNPNPHINFITPLPMADEAVQEEARQLLRALAAQLKPIMKSHGLSVNSFEEVSCDNLSASLWSRGHSTSTSTNSTKYSREGIGTTAK